MYVPNNGASKWRKQGTGVAQSLKPGTLDLSSGHDLEVCGFKPRDSRGSAWDPCSLSLSASSLLTCSLSQSK